MRETVWDEMETIGTYLITYLTKVILVLEHMNLKFCVECRHRFTIMKIKKKNLQLFIVLIETLS